MRPLTPGFRWNPKTKVATFVRYVPGGRGRTRRKRTVTAPTRAKALELWAAFDQELRHIPAEPTPAVPVSSSPTAGLTLAAFVAQEWDAIQRRLARSTRQSYRSLLDRHILPVLGELPLEGITAVRVEDLIATLQDPERETVRKRPLSPATVNAAARVVNAMLRQAVERGALAADPVQRQVAMAHVPSLALELSDSEYARFVAAFDDEPGFRRLLAARRRPSRVTTSDVYRVPRRFGGRVCPDSAAADVLFARFRALKPLFLLAVETGLRQRDLLDLRWAQVDRPGRWIRIEAMRKTKREVQVPLTAVALEALTQLAPAGDLPEFVFTDAEGKRIGLARVLAAFQTAKQLAGITRRFRFHDLRHSCGCRLVAANVNLPQIARWLGHTSTRVTERYARPSVAAMVAARDALDQKSADAGRNSNAPETIVPSALNRERGT